jgi:hypothetical protein
MVVRIMTASMGELTLQTNLDDPAGVYYVMRAATKWSFARMDAESDDPDVYTFNFDMPASGFEDFQIVLNQNLHMRYYPSSKSAAPESCLVCGPDRKGKDKNWRVSGDPFQWHQIRFDLSGREDFRSMVSCRPIDEAAYQGSPELDNQY